MIKLYVASSWRNDHYPHIISYLKTLTWLGIYDFRNSNADFRWTDTISTPLWYPDTTKKMLNHHLAESAFKNDFSALRMCDACILIPPCGISAALEMGWAIGAGKHSAIYYHNESELVRPDLMFKMADKYLIGLAELEEWLRTINPA